MSNLNLTQQIQETMCIGDSLPILNNNFTNLDNITCNLSSISSSIITNITALGNLFSTNISGITNLLNNAVVGVSATGITSLSSTINMFSRTMVSVRGSTQCYMPNDAYPFVGYTGTITLPTNVPNTANYIILRANISDQSYVDLSQVNSHDAPAEFKINGYTIPVTKNPISTLNGASYIMLPKQALYTWNWRFFYTQSITTGYCTPMSCVNTPFNVEIIGYF